MHVPHILLSFTWDCHWFCAFRSARICLVDDSSRIQRDLTRHPSVLPFGKRPYWLLTPRPILETMVVARSQVLRRRWQEPVCHWWLTVTYIFFGFKVTIYESLSIDVFHTILHDLGAELEWNHWIIRKRTRLFWSRTTTPNFCHGRLLTPYLQLFGWSTLLMQHLHHSVQQLLYHFHWMIVWLKSCLTIWCCWLSLDDD